jgi:hypothetical protein
MRFAIPDQNMPSNAAIGPIGIIEMPSNKGVFILSGRDGIDNKFLLRLNGTRRRRSETNG